MKKRITDYHHKARSRKFHGECEKCGKALCSCQAFQYVDGNNAAITRNSPYVCRDCAKKLYGIDIKTPEDAFRLLLLERLLHLNRMASEHGNTQMADCLEHVISVINDL